jgi:mannose-6-phosphate isomerase-like protein (cupin superfamily)/ABC-type transporter Mla MlaB component
MPSRPHGVAFTVRGPLNRTDLSGLCARVSAVLGEAQTDVVLCDVAGVAPDAVTVDALARLQLAARHFRCEVRLRNASAELLELVDFMGLTDVLPESPNGCERYRERPVEMADYTIKNLREVEDMAVRHGFSDSQEARFPRQDLGLETLGLSHQVVKPGKRHAFGHRHKEAEEVYVVLSGAGRCRLDDDIVDVRPLDAIRIGPHVARAFEAGPDGLELLVFSRYAPGDAEILSDFWPG